MSVRLLRRDRSVIAEGSDLAGADLRGSYLAGADLRNANLGNAYLRNADLGGARVNWTSHALMSEIIWQAANSEPRQMLASYVGRRTDWCWDHWEAWRHPEVEWARRVLAEWVQDGDDAPEWIREAAGEGAADAGPGE